MFLRSKVRRKDGKQHRYRSIVENTRVAGGRVVQRHVLYLGEINDSQELAWRRSIEVLEDGEVRPRTLSLFPEDRCEGLVADASVVRVKLAELVELAATEFSWILEDNKPSLEGAHAIGAQLDKLYRIYTKPL
jgi:hypothetical protein